MKHREFSHTFDTMLDVHRVVIAGGGGIVAS